jgi:KUP system potassium uptake protein
LPHWQEAAFSAMERNASRISDFLKLPSDQLVEVGRQIAI